MKKKNKESYAEIGRRLGISRQSARQAALEGRLDPRYRAAHQRRLEADAALAEKRREDLKSTLVEKVSVDRDVRLLFDHLRTVVLRVPGRIAAAVSAETDGRRVHDLLTNALRAACDEFADSIPVEEAPTKRPCEPSRTRRKGKK